jgi:hypothetical protein
VIAIMEMKTPLSKAILTIVPKNNLIIKNNKLKILSNKDRLFKNKCQLSSRLLLLKKDFFKDLKI